MGTTKYPQPTPPPKPKPPNFVIALLILAALFLLGLLARFLWNFWSKAEVAGAGPGHEGRSRGTMHQ